MKYVITESRLSQFIYGYLNTFLENRVVNRVYPYIVISEPISDDNEDWDDMMEFDKIDGRLWVNRRFISNMMDLFGSTKEGTQNYIKDWFENRFEVKVKFVE